MRLVEYISYPGDRAGDTEITSPVPAMLCLRYVETSRFY